MNLSSPSAILVTFLLWSGVFCTTFCHTGTSAKQVGEQCSFPKFLLTGERWVSRVSLERMAMRMEWTFNINSAMSIDRSELPDTVKLQYDCIDSAVSADGHTVLVEVFSSPLSSSISQYQQLVASALPSSLGFQCLRFVPRSSHVVQLLKSAVYSTYVDGRLCGDSQLVLDDYPLIWLRPDASGIVDAGCGVVGGYLFHLQPSSGKEISLLGICAAGPRPPILESDCGGSGEGMSIDFRDLSCMGDLSLPISSRLRCLGTWTDVTSNFTFTVLTDGDRTWPKLWLLRVPSSSASGGGRSLVGHISTEIATVVDAAMTPLSAYNFAYAVHMSPTSFDALCEDESIGCDATLCAVDVVDSGSLSEVYCQKTCNTCLADSGDTWRCAFDGDVRGSWLETSSDLGRANRLIDIGNRTIKFDDESSSESTCVQLDRYSAVSNAPRRFPLVTVYPSTGCRPRYACVELTRRSDAVLTYRIGMTAQWPYVRWSTSYARLRLTADILCDDTMFQTDLFSSAPPSLIGGGSVGEMRAVVLQQNSPLSTVQCNLQLDPGWLLLDGRLSTGASNLTAAISQCDDGKVDRFAFQTIVSSSSSTGDGSNSERLNDDTHRCLATFADSSTGDQYVITATDDAYYCWLFVLRPWSSMTRVYVTLASDCNPDIGDKIELYGYEGYIAMFNVVPPSTQAATAGAHQVLSKSLSRDCSNIAYAVTSKRTTIQATPGPVSVEHRSVVEMSTSRLSGSVPQTQDPVRLPTAPTSTYGLIAVIDTDTMRPDETHTQQVTVSRPVNGVQVEIGEEKNGSSCRSLGCCQQAIHMTFVFVAFKLAWL